jgi:hypothetical protein
MQMNPMGLNLDGSAQLNDMQPNTDPPVWDPNVANYATGANVLNVDPPLIPFTQEGT